MTETHETASPEVQETRHYCLETLKASKVFLLSTAEKLPKLRNGYDKYKGTDNPKELEYLTGLHK